MAQNRADLRKLKRYFVNEEYVHFNVYRSLSLSEKNGKLREILAKLSKDESRHMDLWKSLPVGDNNSSCISILSRVKVPALLVLKRMFSIAFVDRIMERSERIVLDEYARVTKGDHLPEGYRKKIRAVMRDELRHKQKFSTEIIPYEGTMDNVRSIILGLDDGIVEVLAAISGFAMLAHSHIIVAIAGIIIGISGTLSMAGGAYLSSKSERLVEKNSHERNHTLPISDAFYTGLYYLAGAAVVTSPFIFGLSGINGIAVSIALAAIVISTASAIIAVISRTSILKRILEMLAITLTASILTMIIGAVLRTYFGISL